MKEIMLILQNISYIHPDKELLFDNIHLTVNRQDKLALIGNNGAGKSILFKIITGEYQPSGGHLQINEKPYYVPQVFGQFNQLTVAQALGIEEKFSALKNILNGEVSETNMNILDNDWMIEERCREALSYWQLTDLDLSQQLGNLSGGQKTKIFLAGIIIHQPQFVLLDEPSNHLDLTGRQLLYEFIQSTSCTIIVISHDRALLNLVNKVAELSRHSIVMYGGNYEFYKEQKQIEQQALLAQIQGQEKALRKAKEKQRESVERQQKLDARGKNKQEKAGVARIMMNTLRNNAENSTAKIKGAHTNKIVGISDQLQELRAAIPEMDKMKLGFGNSVLHKGKLLVKAENINFRYSSHTLWKEPLSFGIVNGERIVIKGSNGSGKTSLIKIITGVFPPSSGKIYHSIINPVYIDQDYSIINDHLSVYDQAQQFNDGALHEHEIKIRLNRFLFTKEDWDKPCAVLSGGEKMRLILCCLTISTVSPDMIILDEPTNNLDIQNIGILTAAINQYEGTLIVISHDQYFLEEVNLYSSITI